MSRPCSIPRRSRMAADIRLSLQVDASGAVTSIKTFNDALDEIPKKGKAVESVLDKIKSQFESFVSGISFGSGFALAQKGIDAMVGSLSKASTQLLEYSDHMVTLGQRTGFSTDALQTFNVMAKTGGTDLETLTAAATKMESAIVKG